MLRITKGRVINDHTLQNLRLVKTAKYANIISERTFEKGANFIMVTLYRLRNPHTNKYFCQAADIVEESPFEHSIVYTEETVQKILHDANVMGELLLKHIESKDDFKGYVLEKASLDSIIIPDEWAPFVERIARIDHISIQEAQKVFRQELVDYWNRWAVYNPFSSEEMPTKPAPFE